MYGKYQNLFKLHTNVKVFKRANDDDSKVMLTQKKRKHKIKSQMYGNYEALCTSITVVVYLN